ncbi:polysaccharide biosynthesis/export family protein [Flavobacteriaceae bacterium]|nr:polysaccharide biosynthesis/export family protein [Flavobacteriaceae bacterium]
MSSCASKEDIYYLQDAELNAVGTFVYESSLIQPNDILKITVNSVEPLTSLPYNRGANLNGNMPQNIKVMQLEGYLVGLKNTINFPVLGVISTLNLTTQNLAELIKNKLIDGGHLKNPSVNVRLLNAKVTILGEVNTPGTYNFTEQNITLMQALGYAGDLTINGKRDDVLITREVNGVRQVTHIDVTSAEFMKSPYYFVKPNDLIVINPNNPKVKSAGFIGNFANVATVISLALSITILLTR